jgi:hypothetical protein
MFHKLSRTFTTFPLGSKENSKVISTIIHQMQRPQTSTKLRNDYSNLMSLANCNKRIIESKERSIMRYKKMKCINS